jgi:hypothetical protein
MSDPQQQKYVARLRRFQKEVPENKKCFVTLARVRRVDCHRHASPCVRSKARCAASPPTAPTPFS